MSLHRELNLPIEYEQILHDGYCIIPGALEASEISELTRAFDMAFSDSSDSVRPRSSKGHVYAARNLIEGIPLVRSCWQRGRMIDCLRAVLGADFGLVRALFFDKPPDRSWALPWHKDTAIAVRDNSLASSLFSRPTVKAGVPHVVAPDNLLSQMLTLRIHLDDVTDENGPLKVVPGSHLSSDCEGKGIDAAATIYASAGDVLAMRPLLTHASGMSTPQTNRHRRILHLEFAPSQTLPDDYQWHDFVHASAHC